MCAMTFIFVCVLVSQKWWELLTISEILTFKKFGLENVGQGHWVEVIHGDAIRWWIPTSIKVIEHIVMLALTVSETLKFKMFYLENFPMAPSMANTWLPNWCYSNVCSIAPHWWAMFALSLPIDEIFTNQTFYLCEKFDRQNEGQSQRRRATGLAPFELKSSIPYRCILSEISYLSK